MASQFDSADIASRLLKALQTEKSARDALLAVKNQPIAKLGSTISEVLHLLAPLDETQTYAVLEDLGNIVGSNIESIVVVFNPQVQGLIRR